MSNIFVHMAKEALLGKGKETLLPWMNFIWLQIFSERLVDLYLDIIFKINHFSCPD